MEAQGNSSGHSVSVGGGLRSEDGKPSIGLPKAAPPFRLAVKMPAVENSNDSLNFVPALDPMGASVSSPSIEVQLSADYQHVSLEGRVGDSFKMPIEKKLGDLLGVASAQTYADPAIFENIKSSLFERFPNIDPSEYWVESIQVGGPNFSLNVGASASKLGAAAGASLADIGISVLSPERDRRYTVGVKAGVKYGLSVSSSSHSVAGRSHAYSLDVGMWSLKVEALSSSEAHLLRGSNMDSDRSLLPAFSQQHYGFSHLVGIISGIDEVKVVESVRELTINLWNTEHSKAIFEQKIKEHVNIFAQQQGLTTEKTAQYHYLVKTFLSQRFFEQEGKLKTNREQVPDENLVRSSLKQLVSDTTAKINQEVKYFQVKQASMAEPNGDEIDWAPTKIYLSGGAEAMRTGAHIAHLTGRFGEAHKLFGIASVAEKAAGLVGQPLNPLNCLSWLNVGLSVASLFCQDKKQDRNAAIMSAIQALAFQIASIKDQLDHVEHLLDRNQLTFLQGFGQLAFKLETIHENLRLLYDDFRQNKTEQMQSAVTLSQRINNFHERWIAQNQEQTEAAIKDKVLTLLNQQEKWEDKDFDTHWATIFSALNTQANLSALTGKAISLVVNSLADSLKAYGSMAEVGYHLNLITRYLNQQQLGSFHPYQLISVYPTELVHSFLARMSDNKNAEAMVAAENDLLQILPVFHARLNGSPKPLLLPIELEQGWVLLCGLTDAAGQKNVRYFCPQGGALLECEEYFRVQDGEAIPCENFSYPLTSNIIDTGCLIVKAAELFLQQTSQENFFETFRALNRQGVVGVVTLRREQLQQQMPEGAARIDFSENLPNPLIFSYLATTFLYMLDKHFGGPAGPRIGHGLKQQHLDNLKEVLLKGEKLADVILSVRDAELLGELFDRYKAALINFYDEFKKVTKQKEVEWQNEVYVNFDRYLENERRCLADTVGFMNNHVNAYTEGEGTLTPHNDRGISQKFFSYPFKGSCWFRQVIHSGHYSKGPNPDDLKPHVYDHRVQSYLTSRRNDIAERLGAVIRQIDHIHTHTQKSQLSFFQEAFAVYPKKIIHTIKSVQEGYQLLILPLPDDFDVKLKIPDDYYRAELLGVGQLSYQYEIVEEEQANILAIKVFFTFNHEPNAIKERALLAEYHYSFELPGPYLANPDRSEAIWNFWMGNNKPCPVVRFEQIEEGNDNAKNTYHSKRSYNPVFSPPTPGHRNDQPQRHFLIPEDHEMAQRIKHEIQQAIKEKRREFYHSLREKLATNNESAIGKAFSALTVAHRMLEAVLQLAVGEGIKENINGIQSILRSLVSREKILAFFAESDEEFSAYFRLNTHGAINAAGQVQLGAYEMIEQLRQQVSEMLIHCDAGNLYPYLADVLKDVQQYYAEYSRYVVKEVEQEAHPDTQRANFHEMARVLDVRYMMDIMREEGDSEELQKKFLERMVRARQRVIEEAASGSGYHPASSSRAITDVSSQASSSSYGRMFAPPATEAANTGAGSSNTFNGEGPSAAGP